MKVNNPTSPIIYRTKPTEYYDYYFIIDDKTFWGVENYDETIIFEGIHYKFLDHFNKYFQNMGRIINDDYIILKNKIRIKND